MMNEEIEKMYYSTGEVSKELGVSYTTIHGWLKEFNIPVKVTSRGNRRITKDVFRKLRIIRNLTSGVGLTHRGAMKYIKTNGWEFYGKAELVVD